MSIDKQKLAFLVACLCAGSAFSASIPMPHATHGKSCPTAVEKNANTAVVQSEADPRKNALDAKKGVTLQTIGTTVDPSVASHGAGGGGGAGKTQASGTPAQKPIATAQ